MNASDKDIFERLREGEIIRPGDPQRSRLRAESYATMKLVQQLNNSSHPEEIRSLLSQITEREIDASTAIFPPLYINYGKNTKFGKNVFVNFGCTFLDLGGITIEDNVMLAPGVKLLTESHPLSSEERQSLIPKPILIRNNVWIGANATVLQGVTLGENSVVAAGAVVSEDVPANTIVGGIPAKVIKSI
ncbi:sugar O-acetyltransferase [Pontibacter sp. 172403-2]|uniref:sugar O-acetyltransferase n=1 Tax=Pontibacter rufus TaxID=2791028 RepID=UPI0018AFF896|nr:sugar O-acetyltransferase [Pontibacter sp. 172403-2]MBF9255663.1 sugar O-acetyltransferase [Pontibacter sp. 172403-2]